MLGSLAAMPNDSLFPALDADHSKYLAVLRSIEALDSSCFYGRPLGFQVPSILLFNHMAKSSP